MISLHLKSFRLLYVPIEHMLCEEMEDMMNFLTSVSLSEYNSKEMRNPAALRRHKLAEKIEQQIKLAADPNYRPTKSVWNLGEDGVERMFERPKRIKCWWIETALLHKSADGRTSPYPGQTYPTTFVRGMPRAVKPFSTATRTWNSAT
jgi:hypothetical protein